jgi:hypothetical protein
MNPRVIELALKRQRLQLKSAEQRLSLRRDLTEFAPVFSAADTVQAGIAYVRQHPEWLVGAAVVLLVARPRALFRWLQRGLVAWQVARQVRRAIAEFPLAARAH